MITTCPQCGGIRAESDETFAGTPCKCRFVSSEIVSRWVDFDILIPPLESGQETIRKTIKIEVSADDLEIITPRSMETIQRIKMQMMISRLYGTVRNLTGYVFREAEKAAND